MTACYDQVGGNVLHAAADLFVEHSFPEVSMPDIATHAGVSLQAVLSAFPTVHDIGSAILDHERSRMHAIQNDIAQQDVPALEAIPLAFRLVGENLADDPIVRAGVCLASGARRFFPERRLDPFRTWRSYLSVLLETAREHGKLRDHVESREAAWLIVTAGMGTMDYCRTKNLWHEAPNELSQTARSMIQLMVPTHALEHEEQL
ncbi:TetR/AcrR family transcriptional regulator [Brevibacterium luteolum]|uniref:TetR/AcrR family transcriptional regulator n=1 Tax=Brevibacterium luteolum TaxID=199591 RepID=A0A849AWA2_9MICO|nr:TetR/AcrR family transcriptional regulator [Brevibacterium luteolum]MBM7529401.1 AcrR family transcriptional regulator [Brevibacterium luteolum]NNG80325.1 TetR/AcrR family transcriptional regulator [Brevibacterium luteolum]